MRQPLGQNADAVQDRWPEWQNAAKRLGPLNSMSQPLGQNVDEGIGRPPCRPYPPPPVLSE